MRSVDGGIRRHYRGGVVALVVAIVMIAGAFPRLPAVAAPLTGASWSIGQHRMPAHSAYFPLRGAVVFGVKFNAEQRDFEPRVSTFHIGQTIGWVAHLLYKVRASKLSILIRALKPGVAHPTIGPVAAARGDSARVLVVRSLLPGPAAILAGLKTPGKYSLSYLVGRQQFASGIFTLIH